MSSYLAAAVLSWLQPQCWVTEDPKPRKVCFGIKRRNNSNPRAQISKLGSVTKSMRQKKRGLDLGVLVPVKCVICSNYIQLLRHGGIV